MMKNTKYARSRLREKMLLVVAIVSCKLVEYSVCVDSMFLIQEIPRQAVVSANKVVWIVLGMDSR